MLKKKGEGGNLRRVAVKRVLRFFTPNRVHAVAFQKKNCDFAIWAAPLALPGYPHYDRTCDCAIH